MTQAIATELTVHYLDGRNESFTIYEAIPLPPAVQVNPEANPEAETRSRQQDEGQSDPAEPLIRRLLGKDWWVLQLQDKSVLINMNTVVKVEINPPLSSQADDIMAEGGGIGNNLLNAIQDI